METRALSKAQFFEKARLKAAASSELSSKPALTLEEMAKDIDQLKRPQVHSFCNPLNGNSLY